MGGTLQRPTGNLPQRQPGQQAGSGDSRMGDFLAENPSISRGPGGGQGTKPPGQRPPQAQGGLRPTKPPGGQPGRAQSGLQPTKPPGGRPPGQGQDSPWSGLLGALQQPQQFNPRPAWQNWGEQMQNRVNQGQGGAFRQGGRGF